MPRTDPGIADLARGANGLGEAEDGTLPALPLMRAGMAGAMAVGFGAAAVTLGTMARVMSLGIGTRRGPGDREDG